MKIFRETYGGRGGDLEYSITQAVDASCESDTREIAEYAKERAEYVSQMLGDLVALLHERGVLADADVMKLISGFRMEE